MSQSNAINEQIQGLNNELYMTRYIREATSLIERWAAATA